MSKSQPTERKNLLELAKQGNPSAIAALIERSLQPKGIAAKVKLQQNCLFIFVESSQVPDRVAIVAFLRKGIERLGVESIKAVKVYGRQSGENHTAWTDEFKLEQPDDIITSIKKANFDSVVNSDNSDRTVIQSLTHSGQLYKQEPLPSPPKTKFVIADRTLLKNRNFERILLVLLTFAATTLFWNILGSNNSGVNIFTSFSNWIGRRTNISGAAWVTKQGGQSDILRGLEIALCQKNVQKELMQIRNDKWRESLAKNKDRKGYFHLNLDEMNRKVAATDNCLSLVKTNIDGRYTITGVTLGSYFLYASYETAFAKAYWVVPVEVKSTKPIHIDLDNSNMEELHNKE